MHTDGRDCLGVKYDVGRHIEVGVLIDVNMAVADAVSITGTVEF